MTFIYSLNCSNVFNFVQATKRGKIYVTWEMSR